jgi:RNA polymerase sigma factor (sigma-70 family)
MGQSTAPVHARDPREAYRVHGPALVRKAERVLRNRDDAVDVVQTLFVDLIQRRERAVDLPYLYRAVTNRCLNLLRDEANRARLLAREQPSLAPVARVRCDDHVIGSDLVARLTDRLDHGHLEVLICRFFDDMTQDEVASHLGVSRKTVGKRLARIRSEVVDLLGTAPPAEASS